jgi:single-strand DNA-binding protein
MNSITICGALGKDSELRTIQSGDQVLSFSVADSQGREKPTIWWNCQLWGKRAATLQQYLTKGQQVTVVGSVSEREWNDKDGQKRKSMDVRVSEIALQGGKPLQSEAPTRPATMKQAPAPAGGGFNDMDDDIPF